MNKKLLQQAIYIVESNEYLKSSHEHDAKYHTMSDGKNIMIDGGCEYIRRSTEIDSYIQEGKIIDYTLYNDDTIDTCINKLLWGTYGKDGTDRFRYVLLKDCGIDHLKKIKELYMSETSEGMPVRYAEVVEELIKRKTN